MRTFVCEGSRCDVAKPVSSIAPRKQMSLAYHYDDVRENSFAMAAVASSRTSNLRFSTSGRASRNRSTPLVCSLSFCRSKNARASTSLFGGLTASYSRTRIRAYDIRQRRILLRRSVTHCTQHTLAHTRRFEVDYISYEW